MNNNLKNFLFFTRARLNLNVSQKIVLITTPLVVVFLFLFYYLELYFHSETIKETDQIKINQITNLSRVGVFLKIVKSQ